MIFVDRNDAMTLNKIYLCGQIANGLILAEASVAKGIFPADFDHFDLIGLLSTK